MIKEKIRELIHGIYLNHHSCGDNMKIEKEWEEESKHYKNVFYEYRTGCCKVCSRICTRYREKGAKLWYLM